mgnify:CR=1 FL=1
MQCPQCGKFTVQTRSPNFPKWWPVHQCLSCFYWWIPTTATTPGASEGRGDD